MKTVFLISMFGSFETDTFMVCQNKVPSNLKWSTRMVMTALSKSTTACHTVCMVDHTSFRASQNIPFSGDFMRSRIVLVLPCETHLLQNDRDFALRGWHLKSRKTCFLMINSCMIVATQYPGFIRKDLQNVCEYVAKIRVNASDRAVKSLLNFSLYSELLLSKVRPLIMCL